MPQSDGSIGKLEGISMINDWCTKAQTTKGGAAPEQVVLGYIRKQAEQSTVSDQWVVLLQASASFPASRFLPELPALISIRDLWAVS